MAFFLCREDSYRPNYASSFLVLSEKETKTFKSRSKFQFLFSSVYVIYTTCFDECFLFHVMTERHYFLYKGLSFFLIAVLRKSSKPL